MGWREIRWSKSPGIAVAVVGRGTMGEEFALTHSSSDRPPRFPPYEFVHRQPPRETIAEPD